MADSDPRPHDRRREARFALKLAVSTRLPSQARVPGRLLDLSQHGCRLRTHAPLAVGTSCWLMIGNIAPRFCHVVWAVDRFAGIRFAVELDRGVLAQLIEDHGQLSEADIRELRTLSAQCAQLARRGADAGATERLHELARDCASEAIEYDERQRRERVARLLERLSVSR